MTTETPLVDVQWLRNVANSGRGSHMTAALHKAADRIEALETKDSARTKEHNLLVAENKSLERDLAECFRQSGADPDGNEDWRLAPDAVQEVTRMRQEYDETERELAKARKVEVRTDQSGALDEICAAGVHLEQMASNHWFLSVGEVNVWLSAKGKISVTYEDNRAAIDASKGG